MKEFRLMTAGEDQRVLKKGGFKTNSVVVMLDFFIRQDILTPGKEKNYVEIMSAIHRILSFPSVPK